MTGEFIFADTSAWYALLVHDDKFHEAADRFLKSSLPTLLTTNYVLLETVSLLANRHGFDSVRRFIESTSKSPSFSLHVITPEEHERALAGFLENGARGFSLADCSSFLIMRSLGIRRAFAFDKHFKQAGFELVP